MKQYIVIGCGRFGSSLATTMNLLGHQVMAIDKNEEIIQNLSDKVTHVAAVDVTDEYALRSLGLGNFDVAIIAIGSDIRASIMATLIAKEMGVEQVVCKAKDELQEAIELAISYDNKIIVEEAINNLCEVNQSVLGTYDYYETSQIEEVIKEDEILSYKDKYLGSAKTSSKGIASTRRIIPARINEKLSKEIDEISKKVYRNLNCSGVVRIDYLIDTKKKEVYVNEINTIPGSLAYYLWEGKGTSYEELLENLITTTIKDYKKKMKKIASFETNILSNYNSQGLKGIKK